MALNQCSEADSAAGTDGGLLDAETEQGLQGMTSRWYKQSRSVHKAGVQPPCDVCLEPLDTISLSISPESSGQRVEVTKVHIPGLSRICASVWAPSWPLPSVL